MAGLGIAAALLRRVGVAVGLESHAGGVVAQVEPGEGGGQDEDQQSQGGPGNAPACGVDEVDG